MAAFADGTTNPKDNKKAHADLGAAIRKHFMMTLSTGFYFYLLTPMPTNTGFSKPVCASNPVILAGPKRCMKLALSDERPDERPQGLTSNSSAS
jgi:hypothetical protein